MTIGDRIRAVREGFNKNQRDFSSSIKIGQSTLAMFENGQREPKDIHIEQICLKYGVREDWLRNGDGEMCERTDTDDYSEISTLIGEKDPKARQAIIDYWKLSDSDKELFWKFADRFLKGAED